MADTAERILDTAQALAQVRGYNGFSYADISAELAITKPSIHYHFPSKAELAEALIARYRQRFAAARQEAGDAAAGARERLAGYARLYAEVFTDGGRMCLCGVFAADAASLPPARARSAAQAFLAALEGALLLARAGATAADQAPAPGSGPGDGVVPEVTATMLDALL